MTDYTEQIERIKDKLAEAKKIDHDFQVFGADDHQYNIYKPASLKDVEKFEKKYSVTLPDCFRSFLLHVGNGKKSSSNHYTAGSAAGPYYGLYPLGENVDELIDGDMSKYLKNDCILYPAMTDTDWADLNKNIDNDDDMSDEEYEAELGKIFGGILPLGSQGCTYLHGIVLNGEYKGRVVYLDVDLRKPWFTYEENFLDWYERWLDEIISGELIESEKGFGCTMGGSTRELIAHYEASGDARFKQDCLEAIMTKKEVEKDVLGIIETEYGKQGGEIKQVLLQILIKYNYDRAKSLLEEMAESDLLSVYQFVYWYAKEKSDEWLGLIKKNMDRIDDPETFRFCCYLLEETKSDYADLLIPFTSHASPDLRSDAFYNLGNLDNKEQYLELFIRGLDDDSNDVVLYVLQALTDVKDKKLLKHYKKLSERFPVEKDYILSNLENNLAEYGLDNRTIKDYQD